MPPVTAPPPTTRELFADRRRLLGLLRLAPGASAVLAGCLLLVALTPSVLALLLGRLVSGIETIDGEIDWGALALPLVAVSVMFLLEEAFYAFSTLARTVAGSASTECCAAKCGRCRCGGSRWPNWTTPRSSTTSPAPPTSTRSGSARPGRGQPGSCSCCSVSPQPDSPRSSSPSSSPRCSPCRSWSSACATARCCAASGRAWSPKDPRASASSAAPTTGPVSAAAPRPPKTCACSASAGGSWPAAPQPSSSTSPRCGPGVAGSPSSSSRSSS